MSALAEMTVSFIRLSEWICLRSNAVARVSTVHESPLPRIRLALTETAGEIRALSSSRQFTIPEYAKLSWKESVADTFLYLMAPSSYFEDIMAECERVSLIVRSFSMFIVLTGVFGRLISNENECEAPTEDDIVVSEYDEAGLSSV